MNEQFIKPRYDLGGFAVIPDRVKIAFASGKYNAVVLFLVDAFGWRFFERFQDAPFIKRMAKYGRIEKLISQFPSTTAAHVTTIHTGWPVGQSGVYEWYYYEPQLDAIIAPLLFSYAGSPYRESLTSTGIHPPLIYPRGFFYPELKKLDVNPYVFAIRDYTPSTYSNVVMAGADQYSFKTLRRLSSTWACYSKNRKTLHIFIFILTRSTQSAMTMDPTRRKLRRRSKHSCS
jgi:hypothetical protein